MTTKYDNYDREYWECAGMDEDPRPGMILVVIALGIVALVGMTLAALVIREIVR